MSTEKDITEASQLEQSAGRRALTMGLVSAALLIVSITWLFVAPKVLGIAPHQPEGSGEGFAAAAQELSTKVQEALKWFGACAALAFGSLVVIRWSYGQFQRWDELRSERLKLISRRRKNARSEMTQDEPES